MYNQFQKQSLDFGKQFVEQAYKAQMAALKGLNEIHDLQVKAFEAQAKSNLEFANDSFEVREIQDVTALWPKGLDFARETVEAAYTTGQEIMGIAQKTAEQFGAMARTNFKAANDAATAPAKKAR